jgi:small subunit ribosomal protein S11
MQKAVKNIKKIKDKNYIGNLFIKCSTKNTLFTLTDKNGKTLLQKSTKGSKLKDFKKNTSFTVQTISKDIGKHMNLLNIKFLKCYIKGVSLGRYNFLKILKNYGIKIKYIKDITPTPFNGCRPKKKKRR